MSLRESLKKLGRKTAKLHTRINRVFTPVASAAAGFIGGAPAAAAVTAVGAESGRYFRATQARNEGDYTNARRLGRGERKRVAIYGAAAGGAGMLGSGVYGLATGSTFSQSLGQAAFGQGGAHILGIGGGIFEKAPASNISGIITQSTFAAQKSSSVPGLVTQADLNAVLHGGAAEAAGAGQVAGAAAGTSAWTKALGLTSVLGDALGKAKGSGSRDSGSSEFEHLMDQLGQGGGGGGGEAGSAGGGGFFNSPTDGSMSPALIAALAVGAFLLLA